jgi:hypothetical protein
MKWIEIISLRTAGVNEEEALKYMKKFCRIVVKYTMAEAHSCVHSSVPGDLALVITSESEKDKVMGSEFGEYMVEVLKQFGLVDCNCWLLVDD